MWSTLGSPFSHQNYLTLFENMSSEDYSRVIQYDEINRLNFKVRGRLLEKAQTCMISYED